MKIYDENDVEITNPDLSKGRLVEEIVIKKNATPIDNVTKFAWDDDDYERITRYIVYTELELSDIAESRREEQFKKATTLFVRMSALTDEQALSVSELYEEWSIDGHYKADDIRRYDGELYRCRQEHVAQPSWTPADAHSLWGKIVPPGEIPDWVQPQPGVFDGYEKGQKVKHKGVIWISLYNGLNVWEPGSVGTEALWKKAVS